MRLHHHPIHGQFERGAVILSIDTEQIWGYADFMSEAQYEARFPGALRAHEKLLARLSEARISATWFVVGGMTLDRTTGPRDARFAGLPPDWTARIPSGCEATVPVWYRASFVNRIRTATPRQEIGLHGGLTHFIWTGARATRDVVQWELAEGVHALQGVHVRPRSFAFGRNQEAHHDLLPVHGVRSYRGCPPALSWRLGNTLPGAILRVLDEIARTTPPPVWPYEMLPGLWNIPASGFLYPITRSRARVTGLRSRVERFSRGLDAAARSRGIFHYGLHPENLAESHHGFSLFDEMLERLLAMRESGDIEILTMDDVAERMQRNREIALPADPLLAEPAPAHRHAPMQVEEPVLKPILEEN
jgi:hypothetical protein